MCYLTHKICTDISSVIGEHRLECIFFPIVHGAFKKTACPLQQAFHFASSSQEHIKYHRKTNSNFFGTGLYTWLESLAVVFTRIRPPVGCAWYGPFPVKPTPEVSTLQLSVALLPRAFMCFRLERR
jgi:hypothetical protein